MDKIDLGIVEIGMVPKVRKQDIKDDLGANFKGPESDHKLAADLISFHLHRHLDAEAALGHGLGKGGLDVFRLAVRVEPFHGLSHHGRSAGKT